MAYPEERLRAALPTWEHEFRDSVVVGADPATVFRTLNVVRAHELGLGSWLARVPAPFPQSSDHRPLRALMADMGWISLAEVPNQRIVAGLIGRFWQRGFGVQRVADADAFLDFNEAGFSKVLFVWELEEVAGGTRLRALTRVHTTDTQGARSLRLYWHLIGPGARLGVHSALIAIGRRAEAADPQWVGHVNRSLRQRVRPLVEGVEGLGLLALLVPTWPLAKRLLNDLGARTGERLAIWPGDQLLDRVDRVHTRGIDVQAPAAEVWPWLLQIGLKRGGFYSYELMENLAGFRVRNLERIRPSLQTLEIDQEVVLAPGAPGVWLAQRQEAAHLCFRTWRDSQDVAQRDPATLGTWSLYLVPTSDHSCRLLLRTCTHFRRPPSLTQRLTGQLLEDPLDLVMEQRLLRTVRRLAQGRPRVGLPLADDSDLSRGLRARGRLQ